jgi:hypothetical protein
MSDSESDLEEVKSVDGRLTMGDADEIQIGIYKLGELNMEGLNSLISVAILSNIPKETENLSILLKVCGALGYNLDYHMLNINWIVNNSIEYDGRNDMLSSIFRQLKAPGYRSRGFSVSKRSITQEQKEMLQKLYNRLIQKVPELKNLKEHYLKNVDRMTSEVLKPSDDPDFYDKGVNDLVGSFLFRGRKSRRRSGKRKSPKKLAKRKSPKRKSPKRKSPKRKSRTSRKPKKSK